MVKVSREKLPASQVALQIEVEDDRLERAMDSAFRKLASKVKVPGFRPGKVPRAVLEAHLGQETIRQEAIDLLMPQVYQEALEQEQIDPIDRADVDGTIEGAALVHEEDAEFQLIEGRAVSLPGFTEGLLGHQKGEEF